MLPLKLFFLLLIPASLTIATAQSDVRKDSLTTTQSSSTDSILNLRLAKKVKTTITRISGFLVEGIDEYTYTVLVQNKNEVAVIATIGGLVYGHYTACVEKRENFVPEATIEEKNLTIPAKSSTSIIFMLQRKSNPPSYCMVPPKNRTDI